MKTLHSFILVVIVGMLLYGCNFLPNDTGGDEILPPQTTILDVRVEPDTVAPGDTASFTCIIEDSLDKSFKFYWLVDVGTALNGEVSDPDYPSIYKTIDNSISWLSPQAKGLYSLEIAVNNDSEDSVGVRTSFSIVVE